MHEDVADEYPKVMEDYIRRYRQLADTIASILIRTEEIKQLIQDLSDQNRQTRDILSKLEWRPTLVDKLFEIPTDHSTIQSDLQVHVYEEYLLLMKDIHQALGTPSMSSPKVREMNKKIGIWLQSLANTQRILYHRQSDNISGAGFFPNAINPVIYGGTYTYTVVNPPHADDGVNALRSDVKYIRRLLFFVFL